MSIASKL